MQGCQKDSDGEETGGCGGAEEEVVPYFHWGLDLGGTKPGIAWIGMGPPHNQQKKGRPNNNSYRECSCSRSMTKYTDCNKSKYHLLILIKSTSISKT